MKELTPDEQKAVKEGEDAAALLENSAMASAINDLSETIVNAIISTSLEEAEKRERLYFMHSALKELVGILNHRVRTKEAIMASVSEQENE